MYTCIWLRHGFGRKPSELGVLLDGTVVDVDQRKIGIVYFSELRPGALDTQEVKDLVEYFKRVQKMGVVRARLSPSGGYDPGAYEIPEEIMSDSEAKLFRHAVNRE